MWNLKMSDSIKFSRKKLDNIHFYEMRSEKFYFILENLFWKCFKCLKVIK